MYGYSLLVVSLIVYSYLLYPFLIKQWARNKTANQLFYEEEELPVVCILIAVFNEEKLIKEKIKNCLDTHYPPNKLKIYIGSDGSTDSTWALIQSIKDNRIQATSFQRMGKGNVLNNLFEQCKQSDQYICVLTDVNVMFDKQTLFEMVKHFKNPAIGLVSAWIKNIDVEKGVGVQEQYYIHQENEVKFAEGCLKGSMAGAFGAAYAVKPGIHQPIPPNFLTDDLFISLQIAVAGYSCMLAKESIATEWVYPTIESEFNRKKRYAAGNWQVLFYHFKSLLQVPTFAFCFFSHKLIRWKLPFLILAWAILLTFNPVETFGIKLLFGLLLVLLLAPWWNKALQKLGIDIKLAKFVSYFVMMNIAMAVGFLNYIKGIESNVWNPTKRN